MFIDKGITNGHIVIAACKDEFITKLSKLAKSWFENMGSEQIWNVKYRQSFAFIGIYGKKYANEKEPWLRK